MNKNKAFLKTVCSVAIPVAIQSMLQASFSIVDQIMIGQLGKVSVAGVGLVGKFISIFSVLVAAVGTVAGIMISQYVGQNNKQDVKKSFKINMLIVLGIAVLFTLPCLLLPKNIMGLYSTDSNTIKEAACYLVIITFTFVPMAISTIMSTLFRCMEKAMLPLYASIVAALLNTGLNYVLIFGKFGIKPLGMVGAAVATVISQLANLLIMIVMYTKYKSQFEFDSKELYMEDCKEPYIEDAKEVYQEEYKKDKFKWKQYLGVLMPILVCELMWSLGENVYAGIYGHIGTDSCAAMTLINPIQGLMIGALCGLSQAAGVIIGKLLGNKEYDEAYIGSKKMILYGFVGSMILSVIIVIIRPFYVRIYDVEESVRTITQQILIAYAIVAPFKVLNMILSGGIIRSGGKTKYVMAIDIIGTWIFGVPLGLIAAFVFNLSIPYVYFILSLEECVRFAISVFVFRRKSWMRSLQ